MRYETLEELEKINDQYSGYRSLTQEELEKIKSICSLLERNRQGEPVIADSDKIWCFHPEKGEITKGGYLEKRESSGLSVCVYPTAPYINERGWTDASGGPWWPMTREQMSQAEYSGKMLATFWTWCRWGPGGGHGVYFQAEVNLWKVIDSRFYKHDAQDGLI